MSKPKHTKRYFVPQFEGQETVVIKTQKELDELPSGFDKYTRIEIRSSERIIVRRAYGNSSVEACDNSSVEARNNSSVEARDKSSVVARDNSSVEAWGNSSVVAWSNSSVLAWGKSSVEAWGNSSVVARDNSSVLARGHSSVLACDNSSVEAWGNSSVLAKGNSSVVAWGNSSVEARGYSSVAAWDYSSVVAWDYSSVEVFLFAYAIILWPSVKVKRVLDHSTVVFRGVPINAEEKSNTACIREVPIDREISFEEWLRRGYVVADGIQKRLKSQKTINGVAVFECEDFPKKTTSYVVRRGDLFSHGETVEKAIEDLRFKIGDRDTSDFESWREDLDQEVSFEDAVAAYRTVTGACEFGVKEFVKSIQVPEKLTPNVIVGLTRGHFGSNEFREFLGVTTAIVKAEGHNS